MCNTKCEIIKSVLVLFLNTQLAIGEIAVVHQKIKDSQ